MDALETITAEVDDELVATLREAVLLLHAVEAAENSTAFADALVALDEEQLRSIVTIVLLERKSIELGPDGFEAWRSSPLQ